MIAHEPQPKHDPIADILGEKDQESKINKPDRDRFMKLVTTATRILNQHPDTRIVEDERGKPIVKEVVDDVELPQGEARIWVKIRPTPEGYGSKLRGQPVVSVMVAEKFETLHKGYRIDPTTQEKVEYEFKGRPVSRIEYFSDGTISCDWGDSVEDLNASDFPPDDGSIEWYKQYGHLGNRVNTDGVSEHVDNLNRVFMFNPETDESYYDPNLPSVDWSYLDDTEPALQALVDKI